MAVTRGSAVRLHPSHRADAHDMFLRGMPATVAGVFTDVDGDQHLAVTVDDDPATEVLAWQGRYLFFHPDEVEPLVRVGARPVTGGILVAGIGNIFQSDDAFGVEVAAASACGLFRRAYGSRTTASVASIWRTNC